MDDNWAVEQPTSQDLQAQIRALMTAVTQAALPKPTAADLLNVMTQQGYNLEGSYRQEMGKLTDDEVAQLLKVFERVEAAKPADLQKIYAGIANFYEDFYGWEGTRTEDLRGWTLSIPT